MKPETQLLLIRFGGVILILLSFVLNATVLKGSGAESTVSTLVGLLFGWLGIDNPIKKAQREKQIEALSVPPPGGVS